MEQKDKREVEFFLSFSDLASVCKKGKKFILYFSLVFAFLGAAYAMTRPIQYRVEGTFREKGIAQSGLAKSLSSYFLGGGEGSESEAVTMMKSRKLMQAMVKRANLQASIVKKERKNPFKIFSLFKKNLAVEYAYFRKKKTPALATPVADLIVKDIRYDEEIPQSFLITFRNGEEFIVQDTKKNALGLGKLGAPTVIDNFEFTLVAPTDSPQQMTEYELTVYPLAQTADDYAKLFSIDSDRFDKGLLKMGYTYHNRHLAAEHLNTLMAVYQENLHKEHQRVSDYQIDYLQQRHSEMSQDLEKLMQTHASEISSDVVTCGHHSVEKAMEFHANNLQEYRKKLLSIDLEIQRFKKAQADGEEFYDKFISETNPLVINTLSSQIRDLKQEADALRLVIRNYEDKDLAQLESEFSRQLVQIEENKTYAKEAKALLAALEHGKELAGAQSLSKNPKTMVSFWQKKLQEAAPEEQSVCRASFAAYLENLIHFLEVQQRSVEERLAHQQPSQNEFQGINLSTARELFLAYCRELNEVESKITQHDYILQQMKNQDFELTSLTTVLQDSVSSEMISKAREIILALRDADNRSTKEQERLKTELHIQKGFLTDHIAQTINLLKLRENLIRTKIRDLQATNLALIQEQTSILKEHMTEYIVNRLASLEQEKDLLNGYISGLQRQMAELPAKWIASKLIDEQMETNLKMVEELTKLVESKNISSNLETIQSAPIDLAVAPLHPKSPRIFVFTLIGACLGAFFGLSWRLVSSISNGVQASEENLRLSGQHVCGKLKRAYTDITKDAILDCDLETFRRLSRFLLSSKEKKALLLVGNGPCYAQNVAQLMSKTGAKILILSISFNQDCPEGEGPGLLQYLEGRASSPKIISDNGVDRIHVGGFSRYSNELIALPKFDELLHTLEQSYDLIFLMSHATPYSAEAEFLLEKFDLAVISVSCETLERMKGCINFAEKYREEKKITFIVSNSTCTS